ncbi:MAG: MBL fold metallo-hydrolase [Ignavibacteriales bacterium]|nr:MBL fold metallo-hydrolase [Ignavibacteriales bacterium]
MTNKLTWYGHATLGLETGGYKLIIDPFFTGNPAAPIAPEAVEADFILVSHGHGDHVGDAVAIAKRTGATVISNFEIADWFAENRDCAQDPWSAPRRRAHTSLRLSQTDARPARLGAPRRLERRQPVRLPAHHQRCEEDLLRAGYRPVRGHETDRRGRSGSGGHPHRRQLHHGSRRRPARGQNAGAEGRHPHPLQHLGPAGAGCERLGGTRPKGDEDEGGRLEAGGELLAVDRGR